MNQEHYLAVRYKILNFLFLFWKGIQLKFFMLDQNVKICLKYNLTKFEISSPCGFQDIAVQN